MKCLVVDPSPTARRTLVRVLRDAGVDDVLTTDSSAEARRILESEDGRGVELILSDWDLPGESGLDLARGLRREGDRTVPPLLLLSTRSAREDVVRAAEAGVSGYLLKPIDPEALGNRIEAILGPLRTEVEASAEPASGDAAPAEGPESAEAPDAVATDIAPGNPGAETGPAVLDETASEDEPEARQAA